MERLKLWDKAPFLKDEEPMLAHYPAENKKTNATIIVFSGGGYAYRTAKESEEYALFLNSIGMDAFVCDYRVYPARFPVQLLDARRAVRFVRTNAEKYGIDPNKIAVMGSSAGGHLAALVSNYNESIENENLDDVDNVSYMPNATSLCYPVIHYPDGVNIMQSSSFERLIDKEYHKTISPDLLVSETTPPAFIWQTSADDVMHSYLYAIALKRYKIPCEMHIFHKGGHGMGLANGNFLVSQWQTLLKNWLIDNSWL
ncbi:MAG: alpha/beta hydrolase [Lachnospiraceae bacterium]|nr:alpha/beta hydrolase [Lachnospiraceae bacterium]